MNLANGKRDVIAKEVSSPLGIGANRSGAVVYSSLGGAETDIIALDTTIVRWPFTIFR